MHHKHKKRIARIVLSLFVFLIVFFSIYSVINYRVLNNQITSSVERYQYISVFVSSFILESFPSLIGPGTPFATAMLIELDFFITIIILLISTTISALLSYYIGFRYSAEIRKFVDRETLKKYDKLWKKYGKATMIITAITAIPYIPALAGVFKMKFSYFLKVVTVIRILNYFFICTIIYFVVNYHWFGWFS